MGELEEISFQIISTVGASRSYYIEAIQAAKNSNFTLADEFMVQGEEAFVQGHKAHAKLIQAEANGKSIQMNLLLTHAEDQLMSAEAFGIIAREFIDIYKTR